MVRQVLNRFSMCSNVSLLCPLCNLKEESVDHLFYIVVGYGTFGQHDVSEQTFTIRAEALPDKT